MKTTMAFIVKGYEMATKKELTQKYWDINVEHNWYDCIYEDLRERLTAIGVYVEDIGFSGFWAQGDGACFAGTIEDWSKFLPTVGFTSPEAIEYMKSNARVSWTQNGHYYHERSVYYDWRGSLEVLPIPEDEDCLAVLMEDYANVCPHHEPIKMLGWFNALRISPEYKYFCGRVDFEEVFKSEMRGHMQDLYHALEEEYAHQTTEDAIWETIVANELDTELDTEIPSDGIQGERQ